MNNHKQDNVEELQEFLDKHHRTKMVELLQPDINGILRGKRAGRDELETLYRRLQPESFVPLSPNWGYNHRAVALRVPVCDYQDTRIEHRVAGADANPYLVVSAILAGIHYGISQRCEPTEMIAERAVLEEQEITMPRRWDAALDRFRDSNILPDYLGEEFCRVYETVRRSECERFHEQVSNRDYEWYLRGV